MDDRIHWTKFKVRFIAFRKQFKVQLFNEPMLRASASKYGLWTWIQTILTHQIRSIRKLDLIATYAVRLGMRDADAYKWDVDLNLANDAKLTVSMSALCHYAAVIVPSAWQFVFFFLMLLKKKHAHFSAGHCSIALDFVSFFSFIPFVINTSSDQFVRFWWKFSLFSSLSVVTFVTHTHTYNITCSFGHLFFCCYRLVNINVTIWHADLSMCKYLFIVRRHTQQKKPNKSNADRLQSCTMCDSVITRDKIPSSIVCTDGRNFRQYWMGYHDLGKNIIRCTTQFKSQTNAHKSVIRLHLLRIKRKNEKPKSAFLSEQLSSLVQSNNSSTSNNKKCG